MVHFLINLKDPKDRTERLTEKIGIKVEVVKWLKLVR
jgi:hypothetical protein